MENKNRGLHIIRIGLLVITLVVAGIVVIRQMVIKSSALAAVVGIEESANTLQDTIPQASVFLPDFPRPAENIERGIPRRILLHTTIPDRPSVDVATYVVKPGDNLFMIAEKYGLRPETVLWGNYEVLRDNPQFLRPGQELSILPTDGVYYQWTANDNLNSIAGFFRVEPDAIINFPGNRVFSDLTALATTQVPVGTWLIIPGGERDLKDWGPPAITRKNAASAAYYGSGYCGAIYEGAIGTGGFIWPTVATSLSGYDYSPSLHPGLDIAGAEGNAVFATDSGVVVYSGWSEYGYGYLIVLDHGNGWQSAYAHLSAVSVGCGQSVAQGNLIGAVGNTGNSTGAHLHFEMRSEIYGKVNPWDFVSP